MTPVAVDIGTRDTRRVGLARPDGTYRLPLGDAAGPVPVVERAVLTFAPHLHRGVQDEGFTVALS